MGKAVQVFKKDNNKLELYYELNEIIDSMLFSSGDTICTLFVGDEKISIEVQGEVRVNYKDEPYYDVSEFPSELVKLFESGDAYDDDDVVLDSNNWFECCYFDENGVYIDSDVIEDLEDCKSVEDLYNTCMEWYKCFKG